MRSGKTWLLPIGAPTVKDPHYRGTCKGVAAWAWQRKDTRVAYDQFVTGAHQHNANCHKLVLKLRDQEMTSPQTATEIGWPEMILVKIVCDARTISSTPLFLGALYTGVPAVSVFGDPNADQDRMRLLLKNHDIATSRQDVVVEQVGED